MLIKTYKIILKTHASPWKKDKNETQEYSTKHTTLKYALPANKRNVDS